jgi:hypothetical protein
MKDEQHVSFILAFKQIVRSERGNYPDLSPAVVPDSPHGMLAILDIIHIARINYPDKVMFFND